MQLAIWLSKQITSFDKFLQLFVTFIFKIYLISIQIIY